jgi:hypothetical protein
MDAELIGRKVKLFTVPDSQPAQIYSHGFEYATCTKHNNRKNTLKQLIPFIYCKDFLHDVVWAAVNNKKYGIYGLNYDPTTSPDNSLSLDKVRLAVRDKSIPSNDMITNMRNTTNFLNAVEKICKFSPTTINSVISTEQPGAIKKPESKKKATFAGIFLVEGDKRWIHAPPLLSLYTLLLRVGFKYVEGENPIEYINKAVKGGFRDSHYLTSLINAKLIPLLFEKNVSMFNSNIKDNYPSDKDSSYVHNQLGIVAFSQKYLSGKPDIKGWAFVEKINDKEKK